MMIDGSQEYLAKIQNAEHLRLFLDYDGTLAEFAPTPDEIYPDPVLISLIERLRDDPRIEVSVISGRRLSHIQKLIPLSGILLAGTYGIEIQLADGGQVERVEFDKVRPVLEGIKPAWAELIAHHPDFYLEDKGWSLALHAKDVPDTTAESVLSHARDFLSKIQGRLADFRIMGGHKFLEIAPNLANKGTTIESLLDQKDDGGLPVYIGDDDKDEEGFEKILTHGGVAIKVCASGCETIAQLRAANPREVRKFLNTLLED